MALSRAAQYVYVIAFLDNLKGKETVAQRRQNYVVILGRRYLNKGCTVCERKEIETYSN